MAPPSQIGPLSCVVIGAGVWGQRHAATLRAIERETGLVRLVALADPDESRMTAVAGALGVRGYADVAEMLRHEQAEAACVCSPDQSHVGPALACLERRLHVLIEKPLATTTPDAQRLADAARRAGTVVTVGHILRYVPQYAAAHQAVVEGRLGHLVHLVARRFSLVTSGERIGGRTSLTMFQAIHDLDVLRWLAGPVARVHAEACSRSLARFRVADSMIATLLFAGGAVGVVECSWALPRDAPRLLEQELDVVGTTGRVHVIGDELGLQITGVPHALPQVSLLGETPQALRVELLAFVDAIRQGVPPAVSVDDAVEAVRLAEAVDRSLAEGRPVNLD